MSAAPLPCASSGTFANLVALGPDGCEIGNLVFSGFTYRATASEGDTPLPSTSFAYDVVDVGNQIGFNFSAASLTASTGEIFDVHIDYTVTSPQATIISDHMEMTGFALVAGTVSATETFCKDHSYSGCPTGQSDTISTYDIPSIPMTLKIANATFSAVSILGIDKDINVNGGSGGYATMSGLLETVDQTTTTPEPTTLLSLGSGLMLLCWFGRRKIAAK